MLVQVLGFLVLVKVLAQKLLSSLLVGVRRIRMVDGAAVDTEATAAVLDADPDTANFSLDRGSSPS